MAKEPTPPPGKKVKPPIHRSGKTEKAAHITKPPPPPAPPPKSGSAPLVAGIDAKLDTLTELVEAMAGAMVEGSAAGRIGLNRLLARRRGDCEQCCGERRVCWNGMDTRTCPACNGTGKAQDEIGESDDD